MFGFEFHRLLCWHQDISKAMIAVINHQDEFYIKRLVCRILRHYANATDNTLDDEMVDIIEMHLLGQPPNL